MRRIFYCATASLFITVVLLGCVNQPGTQADATSSSQLVDENAPVTVVSHLDIVRTKLDRGVALLRSYATASRQEPGAERIEIFGQVGYANHFTIVETWANLSAYDAHVSDPSVREFHNQLNPLLGSPHDERIYRDVSGKNPRH